MIASMTVASEEHKIDSLTPNDLKRLRWAAGIHAGEDRSRRYPDAPSLPASQGGGPLAGLRGGS
jgi:hypothetical protein